MWLQLWPVRWKGRFLGTIPSLPEKDGQEGIVSSPSDAPGYDWVTWKLQCPLSQVSYAEYNPHILRVGEQWDRKLMLRASLNKIINFCWSSSVELGFLLLADQVSQQTHRTSYYISIYSVYQVNLSVYFQVNLLYSAILIFPHLIKNLHAPPQVHTLKIKLFKIKLLWDQIVLSSVKFHFLMVCPHDLQFTVAAWAPILGSSHFPSIYLLLKCCLQGTSLILSFHDTFYGQYLFFFPNSPLLPLGAFVLALSLFCHMVPLFVCLSVLLAVGEPWAQRLSTTFISVCLAAPSAMFHTECGSSEPPRWML